jgi:HSP20 family protein
MVMSQVPEKNQRTVPSLFTDFFGRDFFDDDFFSLAPLTRNVPAANVKETNGNFLVELSAPGYEKGDFRVSVEDDVLRVEARREEKKEEEGERFTRREFRTLSFSRSFRLPKAVRNDQISAQYENGILKLVVPKVQETNQSGSKEINVS